MASSRCLLSILLLHSSVGPKTTMSSSSSSSSSLSSVSWSQSSSRGVCVATDAVSTTAVLSLRRVLRWVCALSVLLTRRRRIAFLRSPVPPDGSFVPLSYPSATAASCVERYGFGEWLGWSDSGGSSPLSLASVLIDLYSINFLPNYLPRPNFNLT